MALNLAFNLLNGSPQSFFDGDSFFCGAATNKPRIAHVELSNEKQTVCLASKIERKIKAKDEHKDKCQINFGFQQK
jgi:hypothetical protein